MRNEVKATIVVIEGINGSGKTTLSDLLAKALKGRDIHESYVHQTKEPHSTPYGALLHDTATATVEAATADRAVHLSQLEGVLVRPHNIILFDRYYHSTAVYQGWEVEWRSVLSRQRETFPAPDVTVFLDTSPSVAADRRPNDSFTKGVTEYTASRLYKEVMDSLGISSYDKRFFEIVIKNILGYRDEKIAKYYEDNFAVEYHHRL